ncbi:hypothetical protein [Streptomyces sp. C8S0]|uniref:hypothetical protein n=1 Tax=Streptomyces sp. C8S0 TaxID=2585716 RepID=UPI001D03E4B0|nr:hypothetical protein [Streptomyces sp. C8S0]
MTVLLHANPDVFPADPPRDPDDAAVIAEHDWAAFSQVTVMTNHWDRPGWTDETRAYYWLLTITDEAFVAHAQQCQRAVRDLGFDEIDQRRFHLTLGRIGLVEEVSTRSSGRWQKPWQPRPRPPSTSRRYL